MKLSLDRTLSSAFLFIRMNKKRIGQVTQDKLRTYTTEFTLLSAWMFTHKNINFWPCGRETLSFPKPTLQKWSKYFLKLNYSENRVFFKKHWGSIDHSFTAEVCTKELAAFRAYSNFNTHILHWNLETINNCDEFLCIGKEILRHICFLLLEWPIEIGVECNWTI